MPKPVSGFASIDPGLNHTAWAVWDDGRLSAAGLTRIDWSRYPGMERAEKWRLMGLAVGKVIPPDGFLVCEIPQVYTRERSKGDPNDLIDLAGVVGAITQHSTSVEWSPVPRDWKGQIPKNVTELRVKSALGPDELAVIDPRIPASLLHNTYDAIHLGLVYLRREGLRP